MGFGRLSVVQAFTLGTVLSRPAGGRSWAMITMDRLKRQFLEQYSLGLGNHHAKPSGKHSILVCALATAFKCLPAKV